jgi:hypothetical protein
VLQTGVLVPENMSQHFFRRQLGVNANVFSLFSAIKQLLVEKMETVFESTDLPCVLIISSCTWVGTPMELVGTPMELVGTHYQCRHSEVNFYGCEIMVNADDST